jgi:hypothetical protein
MEKQALPNTFQPLPSPREEIRRRAQEFGYARVAEVAGIKAYQTVSNFCEGRNVHESTRTQILSALEKLEADRLREYRQQGTSPQNGFQVVPLSDFNDLHQRVERLSSRLAMLMKTLLAAHQWVGSQQAADILDCSTITLHRRKQAGELEHRKTGGRVEYNIEGLMAYLQSRHIRAEVIEERVLAALAV